MADNKREPQIERDTSNEAGDARSDPHGHRVTETEAESDANAAPDVAPQAIHEATPEATTREIGGRKGPDPARYGDWEKQGRCIDF